MHILKTQLLNISKWDSICPPVTLNYIISIPTNDIDIL